MRLGYLMLRFILIQSTPAYRYIFWCNISQDFLFYTKEKEFKRAKKNKILTTDGDKSCQYFQVQTAAEVKEIEQFH